MSGFVFGATGPAAGRLFRRAVSAQRPSTVRMCASTAGTEAKDSKAISDQEWRRLLNPEQYRVLRQKGTEYPGTGEYDKVFPEKGVFVCSGCGESLYTAESKFDSGSGWPAFYEGVPGAVVEDTDADGRRTEILCANCGGHLGHVFKGEGFPTPTNARHCVNSICLTYKSES